MKDVTAVKSIFKKIAYVILILLVTLCLYTFLMTDILKKDYANVFGYTYFVVSTGSMSGTIEVNDIIFVKVGNKDVKKNDIVTYKDKSGVMVTHRVVEVLGNKIITKGDVNNSEDDPISKSDIVGRVTLHVSPSFILKCIAIFIILFIFLALVNFDKVVKKYIVKQDDKKEDLEKKATEEIKTSAKEKDTPHVDNVPKEVFMKDAEVIDKETGLTVTIPLEDLKKMEIVHNREEKEKDNVEMFDEVEVVEVLDINANDIIRKSSDSRERENQLMEAVLGLLSLKNDKIQKTRINKKWLIRYQFVYKMANVLLLNDKTDLIEMMEHPSFKEIYDYDLDQVGLYENLRNKIYEMPIYVFLRLLFFSILYNDEAFFDGIFKILKYKIQLDSDGRFRYIDKKDRYTIKQLKSLIAFMRKISNRFDNKNVFELDKIDRMTKIKSYINS